MKVLFIAKRHGEGQGIMYLSAILKDNDFEVHYIDADEYDEVQRVVEDIRPDLLAYSTTSGEYPKFKNIAHKLRDKYGIFSIIGGPHATFFGEGIINDKESGFDGACVGEGEYALLDLCKALRDGKDYLHIGNWIFRDGDKVVINEVRSYIENLDELPIPDFSLSQEIAHNERMLIWLHRGCPYNCTYCMNHALRKIYKGKGKVIRVPSPERSIEIIKARINLLNNEGKAILFKDDTFSHDIEWLKVFCDLYKREIGLPWGAHLYPMMINEERITIMKDAGCEVIETAIETGNSERRAKLLKRPMSDEAIIRAAEIVHRAGLCMRVQNILLLPGETFNTAWETMCLSIKCSADVSTSTKFQPYPGLELTQSAIDMGHIKIGEFEDKIPLDFHWNSILDFKDKSELKRMINLHHMFSFGVYFPIFKPLVWLLTFLPTSKFHYHIDNIAWSYITHRSARFIKRGIWVKVLVFFIFLYNFCRHSKIKETLGRNYGEGVQRGKLEKVY